MEIWQKTHSKHRLKGIGNSDLLDLPMTAFFASRQCPDTAITAAMDWTLQQDLCAQWRADGRQLQLL